jgi:SAM-dependent methyltransferase
MTGSDEKRPAATGVAGFYDGLAADYHLAYGGDWESAVERQGAGLHELIQRALPGAADVLDCSCGIGTQAIGLARRGYRVCGTDVSESEIDRARLEAERLGAPVSFGVADFRDLSSVSGVFDTVISCDNAIPHLLDEDDVPKALQQMRAKLRPGGLLVVTMRDFDRALIERPAIAPPEIESGPPRRVLVRLHDWDEGRPFYTVRFLVLTQNDSGWSVAEHTTRYRAITRDELTRAAVAADFGDVTWLPGRQVEGFHWQQVMTAISATVDA